MPRYIARFYLADAVEPFHEWTSLTAIDDHDAEAIIRRVVSVHQRHGTVDRFLRDTDRFDYREAGTAPFTATRRKV